MLVIWWVCLTWMFSDRLFCAARCVGCLTVVCWFECVFGFWVWFVLLRFWVLMVLFEWFGCVCGIASLLCFVSWFGLILLSFGLVCAATLLFLILGGLVGCCRLLFAVFSVVTGFVVL